MTDRGADRQRYAEAISAHPQVDKLLAQWDARREPAPAPEPQPTYARPSPETRSLYVDAAAKHDRNPTGFLAKDHVMKLLKQWEDRSAAWTAHDRGDQ
jgi:hypothetical protein